MSSGGGLGRHIWILSYINYRLAPYLELYKNKEVVKKFFNNN